VVTEKSAIQDMLPKNAVILFDDMNIESCRPSIFVAPFNIRDKTHKHGFISSVYFYIASDIIACKQDKTS
jgi:hypothetical protein